ncbi:urea transporter [Streptomyces sp. NPDC092296]|uniref:urea transporter n=1 Tax=Streptomyces sp. NPDC092296 TaxID=3366012 RepID=UPI00381A0034
MTPRLPAADPRPRPDSSGSLALGTLRGFGQVDLQPSVWTSAVILVSLWVAGWQIGLFATIGAVSSTLTARLLAVQHDTLVQGLMTYCGVLGGIATVVYLGNHVSSYVLAVAAGIMCALVTATLNHLLNPVGLGAFTGPFCLVSAAMMLGAPSFGRVWHGTPKSALTPATPTSPEVVWSDVWHGFFSNVSQVFLVGKWEVGLIMLVGLALAGWKVGLFAALGSIVGLLTAWALGAPAALIREGVYGYNAVLTSLAFGVVLLRFTPWNVGYTVLAAAASTGLTASLAALFKTLGSHTFTWPFNLTTWALLAAVPLLPRITKLSDES